MPYFGVPIRNGLPIGLGTLTALAQAVAVVVPPVSSDPYFEYVSLLANTTSTNGAQNNTFLDSSTNNFSITRNGGNPGMTQGTFSPFSQTGWSNFFDGTGDYLSAAANTAFDFGSGDFTVELWINPSSRTNTDGVISKGNTSSTGNEVWSLEWNSTNNLNFYSGGGLVSPVVVSTTQFAIGVWYHVAVARSGATTKIFVNGTEEASSTTSYTVTAGGTLYIGTGWFAPATRDTSGYISNVRIVKGTAVYTSNFTPPTAPLPLILDTSLLTCQNNRFIDNSGYQFPITRNGDVSVQAFSPFNPTAAWSASTNGGSGYFDGAGDYLSVAHNAALNLSSGDFTIEAFVYWSGLNANSTIIDKDGTSGSSYPQYDISLNGSGFVVCYVGSGNGTSSIQSITSTTALPANTWAHLAFVKSGTTLTLYQNGTSVASATQTATMTDGAKAVLVGYQTGVASTYYFNGYISNLRVVKGTAVYTANFTPPTAPLTAIANTSLLLNFTNAGIYDSASGNDLETVGNAQVSTVQAKWGTTSMAFDGTGDSLTAVDRPALRFGTAPFTIEGWVYLNVINATQGIASKRNATPTGWFLQVTPSNKLQLTFDASTIASTASLAASTWYHFAIVREGTGTNQTKLYINGVNDGTGTVANNFNQTDALAVGSDRGLGSYLNGYIDDLRITNGYARYTANFTPPTAAFPLN